MVQKRIKLESVKLEKEKAKITKCLLCSIKMEKTKFYDHLEDFHFIPIRRERINFKGNLVEETHRQTMKRFKFNHPEYGTDECWCPDCIGGETLVILNKAVSKHGSLIIKHKN